MLENCFIIFLNTKIDFSFFHNSRSFEHINFCRKFKMAVSGGTKCLKKVSTKFGKKFFICFLKRTEFSLVDPITDYKHLNPTFRQKLGRFIKLTTHLY